MKRKTKKPLALSRETLRTLRSEVLVGADGAAAMQSKVNMNCSNGALVCTAVCIINWSMGGCF